jgi:hypothetical protein
MNTASTGSAVVCSISWSGNVWDKAAMDLKMASDRPHGGARRLDGLAILVPETRNPHKRPSIRIPRPTRRPNQSAMARRQRMRLFAKRLELSGNEW